MSPFGQQEPIEARSRLAAAPTALATYRYYDPPSSAPSSAGVPYCNTIYWYREPRARDDQSGAVALRAHRVHPAYERAAGGLDNRFYTAPLTPVMDRLNHYGRVRALVFGNHGEASQDVHHFISPQQRASSRVSRGIGLVLALRMRLMVVMCSAFDVMWALLSRGSLLVTACCVCRLWVCHVL